MLKSYLHYDPESVLLGNCSERGFMGADAPFSKVIRNRNCLMSLAAFFENSHAQPWRWEGGALTGSVHPKGNRVPESSPLTSTSDTHTRAHWHMRTLEHKLHTCTGTYLCAHMHICTHQLPHLHTGALARTHAHERLSF